MGRFRIGMIVVFVLFAWAGSIPTAWGLSAADEAFLKKKIIARWNITGKNQVDAALARGVDILEDHPNTTKGFFTVLVSADELDALRNEGYSLDVVESDWYASYAAKTSLTMGGFLTWNEAVGLPTSKLDSLHTAYPSITTAKFSIGTTHEGNPIYAFKVSDNPEIDEDEPAILFTGVHHAREPISMEIVIHTIRTLLFNYGTDSRITELVNEREIFFVPFVNPDGYLWNEATNPGGGGMWRKNRRNNIGSFGVDPNRNYGFNWGFDNSGSSPTPSSDTYRGPSAFSEPENQSIRDFVDTLGLTIAVNFHSYSNLFLWAPGYADIYSPDEALFQAIGDTVTSFNGYAPEVGWLLYNTNGDSDDWMYYAKGILSFTPEVGSNSDGFWPNPARIPTLVNENIPGNLILIDLADTPARIYPPETPTWIGPSTANAPDFNLTWSDPGGVNAAVSFQLTELGGYSVITDFTDSEDNWALDGFISSPVQAYSGTESFWGGSSDNRRARLVADDYYTPVANDTLRARLWYDIETDWDYAYAEVSSDFGQSWATLPGNVTTNTNPHNNNRGNGITGTSGGVFTEAKFSLAPYVGDQILIRFSYETDASVLEAGIYVDDIHPVVTYSSETVLDPAFAGTSFPITGKAPGVYHYTLLSTDAEGQDGGMTPPHAVTVAYSACDCSCHADPVCDGNIDVLDVVETVNVAFRGLATTFDASCPHNPGGRSDVNCSAATDVIDVVLMVGVAFRGESAATSFCDPCAP